MISGASNSGFSLLSARSVSAVFPASLLMRSIAASVGFSSFLIILSMRLASAILKASSPLTVMRFQRFSMFNARPL